MNFHFNEEEQSILNMIREFSEKEVISLIHLGSGLTHNHIRSKIACGLYYFCICAILDEEGTDVSFAYDLTVITGRLVILKEPVFILPAQTGEIGEEAFAGIKAESVLLGEEVTRVGAKAFAGSTDLSALIVMGSDTAFDESALEGSDFVTVYAPAGSVAESFAEKAGIPFIQLVK